MNHQTIHAAHAPAAVGPYCHAMLCGDTLYTSGQLGLIPETGMDYSHVVKTTVFLADINDFAAINEVYATYFTENPPARSCVQAGALPKGGLFEIEAIAVK